jgi:hypothetical protein
MLLAYLLPAASSGRLRNAQSRPHQNVVLRLDEMKPHAHAAPELDTHD